ncbi:mechanosensitive ion channel family protein [Puniceicoccus vermicola]|uniref:Mechanosensitive ion channel family protein n=1 Tax=Puniceicoccus vermicola TaxID=388746 RepID=A0A7X1E4L0_9BACT|nr:mechanosensitive ion channel family protein [Puniceicoccus vermicola]MBC2600727.1 mechanosensitive ion channel family protein [Puniceicoccus vermicola]
MPEETSTFLDILIVIGIAAGVFLAAKLILRIGCHHLEKVSKRTETIIDDQLLVALRNTKTLLLALFAVWMGTEWLELGRAEKWLDRGGFFVVVLQAGIWATSFLVGFIIFYGKKRSATGESGAGILWFSYLARVVVWSIAFLLIVSNLGYDVTALIAGLGIGGIAIGLAVQSILGDLFASLSIVLDKPFEVGDFIIVGDLLGVVEKIGIKTTRVRSLSGEQLVFSNNDLTSSRIRNFKRMYERRVVFGFGVIYQTTPDQLESIPGMVKSFIEEQEQTRFDRAHFKGFGESSYDFEVVYYVLDPDYNLYMNIQQAVNLAMVRAFAEHEIEFAYPTRTLYLSKSEEEESLDPAES